MAESCRLSPVVLRRNGTRIEEKDSQLYKDIKEAVVDRDLAWELWALTKTPGFNRKYKGLEFDELGEVTFPSLIKALGLQESYDNSKSSEAVARDYGVKNRTFEHSDAAVAKINEINSAEDRHIAYIQKEGDQYRVNVMSRDAAGVEKARQQSYNHALTGELINMLRTLGFDVSFISDPKFQGLFDPENAKLENGLISIIKLSKGEEGEAALPEEFSHLIIEGLSNHPLVKRLMDSINSEQIEEVLGDNYDDYYKEYDGNETRLKKEAAGKMLSQYITGKGTISPSMVQEKRSLLSRIWNWAKNLFSKISRSQLYSARERAYMAIADIYNIVASGETVRLIDRNNILSGDKLYLLNEKLNSIEALANRGLTINAKMLQLTRMKTKGRKRKNKNEDDGSAKHMEIREAHEKGDNDSQVESISLFLGDTNNRIDDLVRRTSSLEKKEREGKLEGMEGAREIAKCNREILELIGGYENFLKTLSSVDEPGNTADLKIDKEQARAIADNAKVLITKLNSLGEFVHNTTFNMLYNVSRTVYSDDKVRDVGSKRKEVMSLKEILEHADRDINFMDRWVSALSEADDPMLTIFDGIVKNQQYERDMEMIEYNAKIAKWDQELRAAGYSSDFMFERKEDGTPSGRIISEYDFDTYNKERFAKIDELRGQLEEGKISNKKYKDLLNNWLSATIDGKPRLIAVYIDPRYNTEEYRSKKKKVPQDAIYEIMPNPEVYSKNKNRINNLSAAQRQYYDRMMGLKREMMLKIPHRGQGIYKAVYISKDFVEGILDNTTGNIGKATLDHYKRKFVRRPDEIGFGTNENFEKDILDILKSEEDSMEAASKIVHLLAESSDEDITNVVTPKKLYKIIERYKDDLDTAQKEIIESIASENFYLVDTDFAGHRVQRLPIYYTRPLKDMSMLSTDFSGSMVAYSSMAVNYEKMDKVIDILEMGRYYVRNQRAFRVNEGKGPMYSKFQVFGKMYKSFVEKAGQDTSTAGRLDDYMSSAVYEQRKKEEGTVDLLGVHVDVARTLDAIKDYTGLLGLGFNLFSTVSNIAMGKVQQWIEAIGGEYFTPKDYFKACAQYAELMPGCVAEMGSPLKKNKLSLLIQMFDPMGDYYESLRDAHYSKSTVSRILGNGALAYIGMNAGEHLLHCQTMLAILNNTKLIDKQGNKISLFDALEVKEGEDGIYRLELKEGLSYERDVIDNTGNKENNKNYGKPLLDKDGKIVTERIALASDLHDNVTQRYIMKKKKIIRKVNDSLNGAFSANDKGALHRWAVGRLIMQFRQWMPAHYERRFARAHYDADLEQWREGYYVTMMKMFAQMAKDIKKGQLEIAKTYGRLSDHEKANLRRAEAEIGLFLAMMTLVKIGGRVKDRDRSWLDKMALYQIHRMHLELGASMPFNSDFFSNIFQIMQSPAASINNFEKFGKLLQVWNIFDEVQTGRYQGWSEYARDWFQMTPAVPQITKAIDFDDSMFSMYERED